MFLSTGLVLFQCTACSRCTSTDFVAPVTMSQIGHVFGGFFSSNIDNIHIKHVIIFLNIIYGQFLRHGHYNSEIFGDLRSSFHIPASVKSQIIHSHYKAVIMDSASYEVEINCLNQL